MDIIILMIFRSHLKYSTMKIQIAIKIDQSFIFLWSAHDLGICHFSHVVWLTDWWLSQVVRNLLWNQPSNPKLPIKALHFEKMPQQSQWMNNYVLME